MLRGVSNCVYYIDDILVTGKNDHEHLASLREVFQRLKHKEIKANKNKSTFMQLSVEYLGHVIDENGVHAAQSKITAIQEAPVPTNLTQLRAFLGLVSIIVTNSFQIWLIYFTRNNLPKKRQKWVWSQQCVHKHLTRPSKP